MKVILFLLFLASSRPAICDHWILHTDRADNPLIVDFLLMSDLSEAIQALSALGRRQDAFVSDIIIRLLEPYSGRQGFEREYLLRVVLTTVFPTELPEEVLRAKLRDNEEALDRLASGLGGLGPPLRCEVLRLLRFVPSAEYDGQILEQGGSLAGMLQAQHGYANAEQASLLRSFIEYAASSANPDFLEPVLRILKLTRSKDLASQSIEAASSLLGVRTVFRNPKEW